MTDFELPGYEGCFTQYSLDIPDYLNCDKKEDDIKMEEDLDNVEGTWCGGQRIIAGLFLGSEVAATNTDFLTRQRISHVLTVARDVDVSNVTKKLGIINHRIEVDDDETSNLTEYFEPCFNWIKDAINSKGRVLVHCHMGVSRSPSIVVAYLMKSQNMCYERAVQHVRKYRSCVRPNSGFEDQLRKYGQFLSQCPPVVEPPKTVKKKRNNGKNNKNKKNLPLCRTLSDFKQKEKKNFHNNSNNSNNINHTNNNITSCSMEKKRGKSKNKKKKKKASLSNTNLSSSDSSSDSIMTTPTTISREPVSSSSTTRATTTPTTTTKSHDNGSSDSIPCKQSSKSSLTKNLDWKFNFEL